MLKTIDRFIKEYAKRYPTLPLEMKIVFVIALILFIVIRNSATELVALGKRLRQLSTKVKSYLPQVTLRRGKKRRVGRPRKPTVRFPLAAVFARRLSRKPVRPSTKRATPLYLLAFTVKLRYFFLGSIFSFLFCFLPLLVIIFLQELPSPRELTLRQIPQTTKIYDRNGILLHQVYAAQNRTLVPLARIPKYMQEATLAIEDKNFYKHPGFDLPAIIRALKANVSGTSFQGGSTLTQQLIKSSMLNPQPSIVRKVKEVVLAFWAERIYSKPEILEMYFNQVPYGGTAWGIEAAAEVYFDKAVQDLDLAESAFLAGITAAPTAYSPFGENPTYWKTRQKEVLSRMTELQYITQEDANTAAAEELVFKTQEQPQKAPHFVNYIKELLSKKYGLATVEKGGLTVITSLDVTTQEMAQKIVTEEVEASRYLNVSNGAALVTNPRNGDILAMVGSKDFTDPASGNFNVTTGKRQPGSTLKVVTYSAALAKGLTAASILEDKPTTFLTASGPYRPENYDGRYFGRVPVRFALANSLNVPAVSVLSYVGIPTMVKLAKDMGVSSWNDKPLDSFGLSTTLGGYEATMLDLSTVFGTLANSGTRVTINPILKISTYKGDILEEKRQAQGKRVVSREIAFIISNILADNQTRMAAFGPNSVLAIPGHTVSVKTGTSDWKKDNWTIGYTNNVVVATWAGNNDGSPMNPALASGVTGAAPMWHKIMAQMLQNSPEAQPTTVAGITQRVCRGRIEYFVVGTEASSECTSMLAPTTYSKRQR